MTVTTVRRAVFWLLALTFGVLVIGWVVWRNGGSARLFFAGFGLFAAAFYCFLGFLAWLVSIAISWRFLPRQVANRYKHRRSTFRLVVFVCFAVFVVAGYYLNRHHLPGRFHPLSIASDLALIVVVTALGRFLLYPTFRWLGATVAASAIVALILAGARVATNERMATPDTNQLAAHAYLNWTPAKQIDKTGVTLNDSTRACPGLNIYNSANEAVARLIDNTGAELHSWSTEAKYDKFDHIELCPNGDLVAITSINGRARKLVRLDWDSNLLWSVRGDYHHDICIAANGDVYAIVSESDIVPFHGFPLPIVNEFVEVRTADGQFKNRVPLLGVLEGFLDTDRIWDGYSWLVSPGGWRVLRDVVRGRNRFYFGRYDAFHVNTVEVVSDKPELLFCARNLDFIAIIDGVTGNLVFQWGPGQVEQPHQPGFTRDGTMLIFDNGPYRGYSRVVEIDPESKNVVWEYTADTPANFFSNVQGSCERLRNGNTLITESTNGRAFEVTPRGEIVWEFYNPQVDASAGQRATIYRFVRIDSTDSISGLAASTSSP